MTGPLCATPGRLWPNAFAFGALPNGCPLLSHDATRTVTIWELARANETANTMISFDINTLWVRCVFPFVRPSPFRRIFVTKPNNQPSALRNSPKGPVSHLALIPGTPSWRRSSDSIEFQIVFQDWVTFGEHKWVNSRERRGTYDSGH